jgi:hypothetical protein
VLALPGARCGWPGDGWCTGLKSMTVQLWRLLVVLPAVGSKYHADTVWSDSACATNDTRICRMGNGTGHSTCTQAGSWSSCTLISCDAGYTLNMSSCVADSCMKKSWVQPCTGHSGAGFQKCDRATGVGGCFLTRCDDGYHYSSGSCKALSIHADPPYVAFQGNSTLRWAIPDALFCMLSANGYVLSNATAAVVSTAVFGPSTNDVTYQLACDMRDGSTRTGRVTVHVPVQTRHRDYSFANMRGANVMDQSQASAIAWFSNAPQLAPIAKRSLALNVLRVNMDLSQAVDKGIAGVGGEMDFLQTLSRTLDALEQQDIKAILVFGIEPSKQYRPDSLCRCPTKISFEYVRPLAQKIVALFGGHPALYAFELMNEAFSTMGDGNRCEHSDIRHFVVAMYELVRTLAPSVPTSVVRPSRLPFFFPVYSYPTQ